MTDWISASETTDPRRNAISHRIATDKTQPLHTIMKTKYWSASTTALAIAALASPAFAAPKAAETIPAVPLGSLSAYPTVVQTGTNPTLTWSILYPSKVSDVGTITPPGSVTLTSSQYVTVQAVGTEVTGSTNGKGGNSVSAEARISFDGGNYDQLFYGTQSDVDPVQVLYYKKHNTGSTINFGGRFVSNDNWTPFYTTKSSNMQVVTLVDGDSIPTTYDLHTSGKLKSYLDPYVDGSGKVDIGPMSVLVLMELAETDSSVSDFDYQDMALLVSFSPKRGNNGHGNNVDGVDSSNPGGGTGGPNGEIDPSGGIDDEIR